MALDDIITGGVRSASPVQGQEKKEDPSVLADIAMAVPRGIEGMVQGVYNLADTITGDDLLPDYDTRKFGRSQTVAGNLVEGTVQFLSAFIPVAGSLGRVGRVAAMGKNVGSAATKLAKGQKHLKYSEWAKVNKLKAKKINLLSDVAAGATADFVAFNGTEERLANLIQSVPALRNPVTEYLQADPSDSELEGRFKNVIEGIFLEAGMRGLGLAFFKGLKTVKARNTNLQNGMERIEADEKALAGSELREDDLTYEPLEERIERVADDEAAINEMGGDYGTPDFRDRDTDGVSPDGSTFDESADIPADTPVDESGVVKAPEERDLPDDAPVAGVRKGFDAAEELSEIKRDVLFVQSGGRGGPDGDTPAQLKRDRRDVEEYIDGLKGRTPEEKALLIKELDKEMDADGKPIEAPKPTETTEPEFRPDPNDDPNPYVDPDADEPIGGRIGVTEVDDIPTRPKPEDAEETFVKEIGEKIKQVIKDNPADAGRKALGSLFRTITSDKERVAFMRAMAKQRIKHNPAVKTTKEELITRNKELMDIIGGDDDAFNRQLIKAQGDVKKLREIQEDQNVLFEMLDMTSENIHGAAQDYLDALESGAMNIDVARTKVYHAIEQAESVQRLWAEMGRGYSLGLLSRRFLYADGVQGKLKNRSDGIEFEGKPSLATMQAYRDKRRGSVSEKKMMNLLLMATDSKDYMPNGKVFKAMQQLTAGGRLRLGFDMTREYWVNALLSGPATQVVNVMGNALTMGLRQAEMAVGAALSGNKELLKATLDMSLVFESFQEGLTAMAKAFRTGELQTIKGNKVFDDTNFEQGAITKSKASKMLGVDENHVFAQTMGYVGSVTRMPSRFLTTGDEFFKTMNYRHHMRVELATKGYEMGLKGPQLAEYITKNMEASITKKNQLYSEDALYMEAVQEANEKGLTFKARRQHISQYMTENRRTMDGFTEDEMKAMIERSKQASLINTHTADAKYGSIPELGKIINDNPWLSFVVPFLRTPANILKFGVERTGLGLFKVRSDMTKLHKLSVDNVNQNLKIANGKERAEIIGRLSTAVSMTSLGLWYVQSNKDIISGYGPRDREEREMWKNAGNQEYSIRIGDKNYSYQRLDPFATMLGIYADIVHGLDSEEIEGGTAEQLFAMLAMTMQNNITNKSYVQGLDSLFQMIRDPIKNAPKFGGNIVGGFVPNILNQSMNYQEDRELKETRTFLDYARKRTPQGAEKLDPKRNLFGEKMTMPTSGIKGVLSPIYEKPISDDIVDHEFANLGHGFSKPSHKIGDIDMREYKTEGGTSAYDRLLELSGTIQMSNGKTMKEALRDLIKSDTYQALPAEGDELSGEKSPRVKLLARVMRAYRVRARAQMLDEVEELRNAYSTAIQSKYNYLNQGNTDG